MVKCVYIDPPYNTGSDGFVYSDKFNFTVEELIERLSLDEGQAQRIIDMTNRGSASHSAWLTFMYPRLLLAKDLLKEDGVIFISADDNEQANLKLLCDDVFGEENMLSNLIWKTDGNFDNQAKIKNCHEYILVYNKNRSLFPAPPTIDPNIPETSKLFNDVIRNTIVKNGPKNPISDIVIPVGFPAEIIEGTIGKKDDFWPQYDKDITVEAYRTTSQVVATSGWASKDLIQSYIDNEFQPVYDTKGQSCEFILTNNGTIEVIKKRADNQSHVISVLTNLSSTQKAGALLKDIDIPFSFPKPVELIKYFLEMNMGDDFITLDFFSGSSTTAHAVMQLNAEDGGNRKYIMVQLPEEVKEKSEAYKAGYRTINQIGIERIKRAAKKIREETNADIDYGFKHYELIEPSPNTLDKLESFDPNAFIADKTILDEFGSATILSTWAVKDGYGFNPPMEVIDLEDYTAYLCKKHLYMINPDIKDASIIKLMEKFEMEGDFNPENIVLFGYSFISWTQIEMLKNNIKQLNNSEKNLKVNVITRY